MIAQANSRISAAEFHLSLRNFVSNVENAYWDLVFAYRDLEAKKSARDRTLNTWRMLENLKNEGIVEQDKVEQALEQYYRFKEEVENAFYGRLAEGTRAFNGSAGGTFQGAAGIHVAERRLRLVMGLPVNTMTLLRPVTEPPAGELVFDPDESIARAVSSRGELQIQQMKIERRNLELLANRNYLTARTRLRCQVSLARTGRQPL